MVEMMSKATVQRVGRRSVLGLLGAGLAAGAAGFAVTRSAAGEGRAIPAPALEAAVAPGATSEVAVLAGGCFWGVQGVFQHVQGVTRAVSGYAGGDAASARYDLVARGATRHAEAVSVTFDPRRINYAHILQIFFSVAHDPTQLNRQGPDVGTQYRSAIFPTTAEQARIAQAYIAQLDQARVFRRAIVTRIEPDQAFYVAEDYHQDYMTRNPTQPYIVIHDLPKVEDLRRLFPERYRADPVLVAATGT